MAFYTQVDYARQLKQSGDTTALFSGNSHHRGDLWAGRYSGYSYDFDFIDSSIEKYDYKRGFCTLTAEVKIPVEDLIMESPFVGSWTVSVPTENGTITLN